MKLTSLPASAAAAVFGVALFAVTTLAQAPQPQGPDGPPPQGPGGEQHTRPPAPPPTNLKVLPKTLTGDQVRDIMHKWEGDLGSECNTCHAVDPTKKMPNGRPALNFADDSKKEKETARLMVKMTEEINKNYMSMAESSHDSSQTAKTVTCGTCHRGHLDPPEFVAPKEHEHEHEHHEAAEAGQPAASH